MINITSKPQWNVSETEVGLELKRAIIEVLHICRTKIPVGTTVRVASLAAILELFDSINLDVIESWSLEKVNMFVGQAMIKDGEIAAPSSIDDILKVKPTRYEPFRNFVRLTVVQLWINKAILAPINYSAPTNLDKVLDAVISKSGNETLCFVRSVNSKSSIEYIGSDKLEDRNRRACHWLRLLLNTSFYDDKCIELDDVKTLLSEASGRKAKLSRYYVADFLLSLNLADDELKYTISTLIGGCKAQTADDKQHNVAGGKVENKQSDTNAKLKLNQAVQCCIDYANCSNTDITIDYLIEYAVGRYRLNKIFGGFGASMDLPIYVMLPDNVKKFAEIINVTYTSYVLSKNLIKKDCHRFSLNIIMFYVTVYLVRFYIERDGQLDDYPETLNDFSCPYFVTRDALLDKIAMFKKNPPITLLDFLKKISEIFKWQNITHYNRVLFIDNYFDYLASNNDLLPNSEKVKNTFTSANHPKISKSLGTNKVPISRKYFAVFVSMLYTLEYLVTHLNEMADGRVPGFVNGKLRYVNRVVLEKQHIWKGLWGNGGNDIKLLDLSLLNYTPIYIYDGKYRPLRKCLRFYKICKYQQNNGDEITYATHHEARITLLMSETGIRQKHLIWLDVDGYDRYVDRTFEHVLCPLYVSTDKAHGGWTAIVSSRVIGICDRQKAFYLNCADPSFDEPMWYGETQGAKFGKFRPLFRQPNKSNNWSNWVVFKKFLWTLQHIIREDLGDHGHPDLVLLSPKGKVGDRKKITEYTKQSFNGYVLVSRHTPHGLRAGFVSEAIRFLPPSLIGGCLTGQTEALVWHYVVSDPDEFMSHQELLANYISKNADAISRGDAPELAAAMARINMKLSSAIETNASEAVEKYRLMSVVGIDDDKSGLKLLQAKKYTKLAFNPTHICPFDNKCPKEIVEHYGSNRPHALCPYAIRGVVHIQAVSAAKDKNYELMHEYQQKIKEYKKRPKSSQNACELDALNENHDNAFREATGLEAIEYQLYVLSKSETNDAYMVKERDALVRHFQRVELTEAEHLIKRLIDVQAFPDLDSPAINRKFAYCRHKLMLNDGNLTRLIADSSNITEANLLTSQIKSMMDVRQLGVKEMFKIISSKTLVEYKAPLKPLIASLMPISSEHCHGTETDSQAI